MSTARLAPAAILRVAAWPIERLDALDDPALGDRAASVDSTDPRAVDEFEREHDSALADQRARLWACTAGDRRFRCALALSSPRLALAVRRSPSGQGLPRNKRRRHLETSLFRYLARGVGRPEPCGLWSGVGLAFLGRGASTQFADVSAHVAIAPELAPLRAVYRALCAREPYRSRGELSINPTLAPAGDVWTFARRDDHGGAHWCELPESSLLAALHRLRGHSGLTRAHIRRALAAFTHDTVVVDASIDGARAHGLVLGGLDFPRRFVTAHDALADAEDALDSPAREAWHACRIHLREVCDALARRIALALDTRGTAGATEQDVLAANEAVRASIVVLAGALDVELPDLPEAILRLDLRAPMSCVLGEWDTASVGAVLDDSERTEVCEGGWSRYAARAPYAPDGPGVSIGARPAAVERAGADASAAVDRAPPLGALVLRPSADGISQGWVRGVSDAPTATHARHAALLAASGDPLLDWFRREYAQLRASCGIESLDLVTDPIGSPNVLARPRYVERSIDPWGAGSLAIAVDAAIGPGPHPAAPVLTNDGHWHSACVFTAASIPESDVVVRRLLATSFSPMADDRAAAAGRPQRGKWGERQVTVGGRIVVPARTWLLRDERDRLVRSRGARRYLAWIALSRAHRWPSRVRILRAGRPGLLVPTSSAIAIDAALEGLVIEERVLVEEVVDGAWARSAEGHHFAEIVCPFRRSRHLWQRACVHAEDPDVAIDG